MDGTNANALGAIAESSEAPLWFMLPHVKPFEETYMSPRPPTFVVRPKVEFKPPTRKLEESPHKALENYFGDKAHGGRDQQRKLVSTQYISDVCPHPSLDLGNEGSR